VLLGGLLPWTPLALVWVSPVWRFLTRPQDIKTVELRLLLWAVIPLVFYTISVGKQPRYILPVLPPMAVLLAQSVLERTRDWRSLDGARVRLRRPASIAIGAVGTGLTLLLIAVAIWRVRPLVADVAGIHSVGATLVIGFAGVAVILVGISSAWRHVPAAVAIAAAISFAALQYGGLAGAGDETVERIARAVLEAGHADVEIGTHEVFVRNLVFYTGLKTTDLITDEQLDTFLGQGSRALLIAPLDAIERLEHRTGKHYPRLAEFAYFNEAGIRVRTLIQPELDRDLTRVALVANH
jgi:hypothetical protein